MNKKWYCINLILLVMIFFCGCNVDYAEILKQNISENCEAYFTGTTQNFYVNLYTGEREEPYLLDGISENKVPYCIVAITPITQLQKSENMTYCVEINGSTVQGAFSESPFDNSFAGDLGLKVKSTDTIFVYVKYADSTEVAKMNCISIAFTITSEVALNSAISNLLPDLLAITEGKEQSVECFIQVINKSPKLNIYFWCVNFVTVSGNCLTIIIDTQTGDILAKNV